MKFQFLEEFFERRLVRFLHLDHIEGEFERDRRLHRRQPLAHQDALAIILQTLAVHFALDFTCPFECLLDRSELDDQIARAFVADAGRARNVVHRIALERKQIGHLFEAARP